MSKDNPKDYFEALMYQLEEDFRVIKCDLHSKDIKGLKKSFKRMAQHIDGTIELNKRKK